MATAEPKVEKFNKQSVWTPKGFPLDKGFGQQQNKRWDSAEGILKFQALQNKHGQDATRY